MKPNFTRGVLGAALLLLSTSSIAQTQLLVGHRGNGSTGQENLEIIDTTGGFSITSTLTLSSDEVTDVEGLYGLALNPFTNEMYCVYGGDGSSSSERRLGIINPADASIADIGIVGTVNDITFLDNELFGSTGDAGDYKFGKIDKATAEFTEILTYTNASASNAFTYDYFNNRFLKSTQGASNYEVIDPITFEETSIPCPSHPGWTTTLLVLNDSTAYSMGNDFAQTLNTNTFAFSLFGSFADNEYVHSSAFTSYPTSLWVNGKRLACKAEGTELVVVGDGTTFEWFKDDVAIDGDLSTLSTDETGWYYCLVDGEATNKVYIEMVDVESPSFVLSDNPVYLEGAPSVDVTCSETVTGAGYAFLWDSGNGETSTDENATFTYDAVGSYTIELTVTDDASGCTGSSTQVLEVIGGVGINELAIDFDLFPVPASDEITITYTGAESYTVEVFNMSGAIVGNNIINPNTPNTIDISTLESGTYFLNITNGVSVTKHKFVKQ